MSEASRHNLQVPDAIVGVVLAVGVAAEALPRQPPHRGRPRQAVLERDRSVREKNHQNPGESLTCLTHFIDL
jgi:hypothetical protein